MKITKKQKQKLDKEAKLVQQTMRSIIEKQLAFNIIATAQVILNGQKGINEIDSEEYAQMQEDLIMGAVTNVVL